jgi:hypothetical protein
MTVLIKGETVRAYVLPDPVKRSLGQISAKFGVPKHHFYHPEMAPGSGSATT